MKPMALISFDVYNDFQHAEFWSSKCKDSPDAVLESDGQVHLFGHIHEQRGHWDRVNGAFEGGVEYRPSPHTAQAARLATGWLGEVVDGRWKNAKTYGKSAQDDVYIG